MKKALFSVMLFATTSGLARGETPLLVPQNATDTAAVAPSDLQKAADAAAAKLEQKPAMFQLALLDESAKSPFDKIGCSDGADLLAYWKLQSPDEVNNQHIANAEAFRGWYKTNCSQAQVAP